MSVRIEDFEVPLYCISINFFCHFLLFSNALLYVYGACLKLTLLCEILCVLLHFEQ